MLIRDAELPGERAGEARRIDLRIAGGRIREVALRLVAEPGEECLEAAGGALLPGLHDHHLHLLALAAALESTRCGPPEVVDAAGLARALAAAPTRAGWIRGVGYHESVAGPLTRDALDALAPAGVPARIQHRSGAAWLLSSAGVAALGLDAGADAPGVERDARGRATGRLFRLDGWLRERLPSEDPPPLGRVGARLAAAGVTGVTDAGPENGAAALAQLEAAVARGALPQRLRVMGTLALPAPSPALVERVARGAVKLLLDERALPPPEALAERIAAAHARERSAAVHCVTRAELLVALAAFETAGARPGDRIEHAAVAPPEAIAALAQLGLCAVTQPGFVRERGDAYLRDVEPRDRAWLVRGAAFLAAGVALGGGTDAPFGEPDPWLAMQAAVDRRTASGALLGADEALSPERALALFTTPAEAPGAAPRRVAAGAAADLCLLREPWARARERLSRDGVAATLCAGQLAFRRDG